MNFNVRPALIAAAVTMLAVANPVLAAGATDATKAAAATTTPAATPATVTFSVGDFSLGTLTLGDKAAADFAPDVAARAMCKVINKHLVDAEKAAVAAVPAAKKDADKKDADKKDADKKDADKKDADKKDVDKDANKKDGDKDANKKDSDKKAEEVKTVPKSYKVKGALPAAPATKTTTDDKAATGPFIVKYGGDLVKTIDVARKAITSTDFPSVTLGTTFEAGQKEFKTAEEKAKAAAEVEVDFGKITWKTSDNKTNSVDCKEVEAGSTQLYVSAAVSVAAIATQLALARFLAWI